MRPPRDLDPRPLTATDWETALTLTAAAKVLGMAPATLRREIELDRIVFYPVGKRYRVPKRAIAAYRAGFRPANAAPVHSPSDSAPDPPTATTEPLRHRFAPWQPAEDLDALDRVLLPVWRGMRRGPAYGAWRQQVERDMETARHASSEGSGPLGAER